MRNVASDNNANNSIDRQKRKRNLSLFPQIKGESIVAGPSEGTAIRGSLYFNLNPSQTWKVQMHLRCWRCLSSASSEIPLLYSRQFTQTFYHMQSFILWCCSLAASTLCFLLLDSNESWRLSAPLFFMYLYYFLHLIFNTSSWFK